MKIFVSVLACALFCSSSLAQVRDVRKPPRLESSAGDSYTLVHAPQIVNPIRVRDGELPWQVGLLIQSGDELLLCGGVAVGPRTVLTAAHCVEGAEKDWTKVVVISGTTDINAGTRSRNVASGGKILDGYNPRTLEHDLAIVYAELAPSVSTIEPSTPFLDDLLIEGTPLIVSGWGRTSEDGNTSLNLMKANVRLISRDHCNDAQRYAGTVTNEMICAGDVDGSDACSGDSGGPLVLMENSKPRLVGVVSWGKGCGQPRYPGVYTRVASFTPWLVEQYRLQPPAASEDPAH
jgi:secreted trypsin-like serine protease